MTEVMTAIELKERALAALDEVKADVIKETELKIGLDTGTGVLIPGAKPCVIICAVMDKTSFFRFRGLCNAKEIWMKVWYIPIGSSDKFLYSLGIFQYIDRAPYDQRQTWSRQIEGG